MFTTFAITLYEMLFLDQAFVDLGIDGTHVACICIIPSIFVALAVSRGAVWSAHTGPHTEQT